MYGICMQERAVPSPSTRANPALWESQHIMTFNYPHPFPPYPSAGIKTRARVSGLLLSGAPGSTGPAGLSPGPFYAGTWASDRFARRWRLALAGANMDTRLKLLQTSLPRPGRRGIGAYKNVPD